MDAAPDDVWGLERWLEALGGAGPVPGLEPRQHDALRPAAAALLAVEADVRPRALRSVDDWDSLTSLRAAVALRGRQVLEVWKPLLPACKEGLSTAPLRDLKRVAAEADALHEALAALEDGGDRAVGLERLRALSGRMGGWMPSAAATAAAREPAKYETMTWHRPAARERIRQGLLSETRLSEPRTAILFGTFLALAAAYFLIEVGIGSLLPEPPPPLITALSAVVPEAKNEVRRGDQLVITVHASWASKPRGTRVRELYALHTVAQVVIWEELVILNPQGRELVRIDRSGDVVWGAELLLQHGPPRAQPRRSLTDGGGVLASRAP